MKYLLHNMNNKQNISIPSYAFNLSCISDDDINIIFRNICW